MDIQEMVNARIEELRSQAVEAATPPAERHLDFQPAHDHRHELAELNELIDSVLTDIAGRVLELAEQTSGDYARLEKDLLNSRLSLLQGAESVLDMALSLRNQARKVLGTGLEGAKYLVHTYGLSNRGVSGPVVAGCGSNEGRASMVTNGVADLFRRTQA